MSGRGAHELRAEHRTAPGRDSRRPPHGSDPFAVIRSNTVRVKQLDDCEAMVRYLVRVDRGAPIDRTWRQIAKGIGKPTEGLTMRECRNRYRGQIRRTLGYLQAWGLLRFEAVYQGERGHSEGRCIVVSLSAGVAQSVRAAES